MFRCVRMGVVAVAASLAATAPAAAAASGEYAVKAVYLYNFARFIEWPPQSFQSPEAPFAICIVGLDPFEGSLDEIVKGERIQGRTLIVRRLKGWDGAEQCQILFVSTSAKEDFEQLLAGHNFRRTLTVGDVTDFLRAGGHISFFLDGNRVRFAIDVDNVARTDLQISSKLMRVARLDRSRSGGSQ